MQTQTSAGQEMETFHETTPPGPEELPRKDGDEPKMEGRSAKGDGSERQFEEPKGVEGVEGRSEESERKPFKVHCASWEIPNVHKDQHGNLGHVPLAKYRASTAGLFASPQSYGQRCVTWLHWTLRCDHQNELDNGYNPY